MPSSIGRRCVKTYKQVKQFGGFEPSPTARETAAVGVSCRDDITAVIATQFGVDQSDADDLDASTTTSTWSGVPSGDSGGGGRLAPHEKARRVP
jgi:hypothetical protein